MSRKSLKKQGAKGRDNRGGRDNRDKRDKRARGNRTSGTNGTKGGKKGREKKRESVKEYVGILSITREGYGFLTQPHIESPYEEDYLETPQNGTPQNGALQNETHQHRPLQNGALQNETFRDDVPEDETWSDTDIILSAGEAKHIKTQSNGDGSAVYITFDKNGKKRVVDTHKMQQESMEVSDRQDIGSDKLWANTRVHQSANRTGNQSAKEEDSQIDDIFIPRSRLRGALHGDKVRVAVRKDGEVIAVLERSKRPYIGVIQIGRNGAWVITSSKNMPYDIEVPIQETMGAKNGEKVAVLVTDFPRKKLSPVGKVVDVLGKPGENDTEMHAILAEFGLPYRFPAEIENAADNISEKIDKRDIAQRMDYRNVCTFTIDPADAKDFDDAISFRVIADSPISATATNGPLYEVGIHIADVSFYVKEGDAIDKEAYERGTSVYLVDRTVPMLPEKLCNKLCSLRPNEEKLTFSVIVEIDAKGKILSSKIGRSVICSDYRFSYEQAQSIIDGVEPQVTTPVPEDVRNAVLKLNEIARILRAARFHKGAIAFERPEIKVYVDEGGKPIDVRAKESTEANFLIEEFMLVANKIVAESVGMVVAKRGRKVSAKGDKATSEAPKTFVYRIHEAPDKEKLQVFDDFIRHVGMKIPKSESTLDWAKNVNKLLHDIKDKPEANAIQLMALRSMNRAVYSTDNKGHYGLAFDYYTHFTSPIRRYPDLMVHRLLTQYASGGKSASKTLYEERCQYASQREQVAVEAERSSIKYKMAEFLQGSEGKIFDAFVSSITEWGMYVELADTHIEGMIALREIESDYFVYDKDNFQLVGRSSGRVFKIGQPLKVSLTRVNLEQKLIDFALCE